jgi:predicted nucleic acid-binding protein
MSRIFFDTNLFIYLFEDFGPLGTRVSELLERMGERKDQLVTSTFTLGELLVKPKEKGDLALFQRYEAALHSPEIRLVPFDSKAAVHYAEVRQDRTIKSPDAIQLSCAAATECDLFITNDEPLAKKNIPGIQFITTLDRVPI